MLSDQVILSVISRWDYQIPSVLLFSASYLGKTHSVGFDVIHIKEGQIRWDLVGFTLRKDKFGGIWWDLHQGRTNLVGFTLW